jgi:hypothetical protein
MTRALAIVQRSLPAVQASEGSTFTRIVIIAAVVPLQERVRRRIREVQVFRHPVLSVYLYGLIRLAITAIRHFTIT